MRSLWDPSTLSCPGIYYFIAHHSRLSPHLAPHSNSSLSSFLIFTQQSRQTATYLLDIVVAQRPPILKLLPCEDQTLLVRRDALFVLDLGFDIVNRVAGLDFEGDGFAREGLDEAESGEDVLILVLIECECGGVGFESDGCG